MKKVSIKIFTDKYVKILGDWPYPFYKNLMQFHGYTDQKTFKIVYYRLYLQLSMEPSRLHKFVVPIFSSNLGFAFYKFISIYINLCQFIKTYTNNCYKFIQMIDINFIGIPNWTFLCFHTLTIGQKWQIFVIR